METIGVALIASNAETTIRDCLESFKDHVDQIVVIINNSKDKTEEICRSINGVEVHNFEWVDDFAIARNFSFSKLKTDWLLWVDSDDTLIHPEGLRELSTIHPEVGAIWFPYHYAHDEFGNVTTIYERERLLRAKYGWVWRSRIHETVSPMFSCKYVRTDKVIVKHNHTAGAPRHDRNFKLLYKMLEEDPEDKRIWLYLGHQHFASQEWLKSSEWYLKFGQDNGAIPLERYQALCYCSKAMREFGERQAIEVALAAVELFPDYRDGYLELATSYLKFGDYPKAIQFAEIAMLKDLIKEPPSIIFINPLDYSFNRLALLSEANLKLNNIDKAIEYAQQAHQIRPTEHTTNNIQYLYALKERNSVENSFKSIAMHLVANKELLKLPMLLEAVPFWMRGGETHLQLTGGVQKFASEMKSEPIVIDGKDKSVFVNVAKQIDIANLLDELDKKYEHVTVVFPTDTDNRYNMYSQYDVEQMIISSPNRHIQNLHVDSHRIICEYDKEMTKGLLVKFFVGQGLEHWSPSTIRYKGCGGSETSVAQVSYEMAKRGHQPVVYAMDDEIWDGVLYRNFSKFQPEGNPCNLFISSRVPDVFDANIQALQKWLWVHDISCFQRLTPERAQAIDVIVVLSHWHADFMKRTYPWLKDAEVIDMDDQDKIYNDEWTAQTYYPDAIIHRLPKIAIIGDAIDTSRFENLNIKKIPHRFIWCSSPDRGLEQVLDLWPLLKKELPDAELKIFYGWEYFDSSLWMPEQRKLKEKIKQLIKQDGIEWCGRVGQTELAFELGKAQCMLYPPPHDFRETYGIAFLEAQAAGCIVFYRQNGALGETVNNRGIPLPLDSTQEQIVEIITRTLSDETTCYNIIRDARTYGLQRSWARQAEKILALYERLA